MEIKSFSYEFLNLNNLNDWLEVANESSHSWHSINDNNILKKHNSINTIRLIIYDSKNPIAIFGGSIQRKNIFYNFFNINYLFCNYEGLIIKENKLNLSSQIYFYLNEKIFNNLLRKEYKIDTIKYYATPNNTSLAYNYNNIKCYYKKKIRNDLLIIKKNQKFLESKKYNLRREIKIGLKNLQYENIKILKNKNEIDINKILILQSEFIKDKKLQNFNYDKNFFTERLNSDFYSFNVIEHNNEYVFLNINSMYDKFITNHYMIQNSYSKKNFFAKAMYYNLVNELNNDQVYILGIENDNKSVDWFKKQMSNSKIEYYIYDFYLSLKSLIILISKLSIFVTIKKLKFYK